MIGGIEVNSEINAFINKYVKEIRNNNAAFFAGAGFSKESGYVDWKTLLEFIASELGLEVEKEHDLVALAQYCYNKHQNRGLINDVIFEEFSKQKEPTQNHRILARLPIGVIWTTNYDDLIEKAFDNVQKIVDVKSRNEHLSNTLANRECILYKMHGDKNNPNDAILIKDDYERYYKAHKQFLSALTGDLISKTFLFVGFSFQDPNLDYILSRIRVDYEENPRQHYAIMKSIDSFENCVAEYNSDDGWDCYAAHGAVTLVNCQANYNGYCDGIYGDGNGFKMGGVDNKTPGKAAHLDPLNHKLIGCTAKGNYANGFDRNNQSGVVTMKNCISDSNKGNNYHWPLTGKPSALGYKVTFGKAIIEDCTNINGKVNITGATLKGNCKGF